MRRLLPFALVALALAGCRVHESFDRNIARRAAEAQGYTGVVLLDTRNRGVSQCADFEAMFALTAVKGEVCAARGARGDILQYVVIPTDVPPAPVLPPELEGVRQGLTAPPARAR